MLDEIHWAYNPHNLGNFVWFKLVFTSGAEISVGDLQFDEGSVTGLRDKTFTNACFDTVG